jgi:CRISPR system Cascade subunit CasB
MNQTENLRTFMKKKLNRLRPGDEDGNLGGERRAALAKLRLGVGREAGTVPAMWKYMYEDFPEDLAGKGDAPSYAENAIHAALTLYAMHAQGKDAPVHDKDAGSLGKAANNLKRKKPENEAGVKRRFDALATAKTAAEINMHARGLIQLLRQNDVKLDYVGFAADLYNLQFNPESAKSVQRKWGRDFYVSTGETASEGGDNA